ncbi:MAG: hypothetical protein ACM31L_10245 [Actinomycetota bacterium]
MAERSARGAVGAGSVEAAGLATSTPAAGEGRGAGEVLRSGTDQAIDEAKEMVREAAEQQRIKAADMVGGVAQALHRTAGSMDSENKIMARYTHIAADRLDEAARWLKQAHWNEMLEGAEGFARRQPYWFIGGAVAAGFLAARLLKGGAAGRGALQ